MQAALLASFGRPTWWVLALAAFLVRGGVLVILLPIVSLPSPAALATVLGPSIEALVLSRQSFEGALFSALAASLVVMVLGAAAFAGSWLDLALLREADRAEELEGLVPAARPSARDALGLRVAAHLPTLAAAVYATVRLVVAAYEDFLSPGDPAVPMAVRVIAQVPDAIVLVIGLWLLGEAVGGLALRHAGEGVPLSRALARGLRDVAGRRGLATLIATNLGVLATLVLLGLVAGRAAERVREYLFETVDPVSLGAALLLLVAAWVLGLALVGAALAWRATAWTAEAGARSAVPAPRPSPLVEESSIA